MNVLIKELNEYADSLERHAGESYASVVKECIKIVEKHKPHNSTFVSLNDEMIHRSMREHYSSHDRQFGY